MTQFAKTTINSNLIHILTTSSSTTSYLIYKYNEDRCGNLIKTAQTIDKC